MLSIPVADVATAQGAGEAPPAISRRLDGLSSAEAAALIEKLADLQGRVRRGENAFFRLLSGAPASYPMTTISPREAFLAMRFQDAMLIERVPTDNPLWQPYKLVVAPNGPGQLVWNVEVVLGFSGEVERVELVYEPPPP